MDLFAEHQPLHDEEPKLSVAVTVGSNPLLASFASFPYASVVVLLGGLAIASSSILVVKYLKPIFKNPSHSQNGHYNHNQDGYYDSINYNYAPSLNSYNGYSNYGYSPSSSSYSENYSQYYR